MLVALAPRTNITIYIFSEGLTRKCRCKLVTDKQELVRKISIQ